jgi:quercetin dioxygenase-like cupin family protein
MRKGRLGGEVPGTGELFQTLVSIGSSRIEHIVSSNTPDTSMQSQDWDEWVLVLHGWADLEVDGRRFQVSAGEWLLLPAGTPHRVLRAVSGTRWLAVHADREADTRHT